MKKLDRLEFVRSNYYLVSLWLTEVLSTESFLEKLNSSSSTRTKDFARTTSPSGTHKFDFGDRTTFPVGPPSERMLDIKRLFCF